MPRRARGRPRRGSLVLLDTNAAFLPFRERLPLADEVSRLLPGAELAVPSSVRAEIERLVGRGAPFARAARSFVLPLRSVPTGGRGDLAVENAARRLRAVVLTADRALSERLRRVGVAVLGPRGRAQLELRFPHARADPPDRPGRGRGATKG